MPSPIQFQDLGLMHYEACWQYQEALLKQTVDNKMLISKGAEGIVLNNYLLFVEHPPVYTIGKSGKVSHLLISQERLNSIGASLVQVNRGGDITFHGPGQIVGYPILDLEQFKTDIGWYLRSLERVIIETLLVFGIAGVRSAGETGVWVDKNGHLSKICAMGVRCSRWVTMHGFALNVNTNLSYFEHIIACGIANKGVTSIERELGDSQDFGAVQAVLKENFARVFDAPLMLF